MFPRSMNGSAAGKEAYMEALLKPLIVFVLLCAALPFLITEMILLRAPFGGRKTRFQSRLILGTVLNFAANAAAFFLIYRKALGGSGLLTRIREIVRMEGVYQDLGRMALASAACMAFSLGLGLLLRAVLFRKEERERISAKLQGALLLILAGWLTAVLLLSAASILGPDKVRIVSVCRRTSEPSDDGERKISYVELYNPGSLGCSLKMICLSDSEEEPLKYPFREVRIPAGGTVRLTSDHEQGPDIRETGGSIVFLSNGDGKVLDRVEVPALLEHAVYRIGTDGETWEIVSLREKAVEIAPPVFSHESGIYEEGFDLTISVSEGLTVRYTLDCSTPTSESLEYRDPIRVYDRSGEPNRFRSVRNVQEDYYNLPEVGTDPVNKGFVIRAAAMDADGNMSETVSKTYFIGLTWLRNGNVVSMVADPEDLFGPNGIYVTGPEYDAWYLENLEEAKKEPRAEAKLHLSGDTPEYASVWDSEPSANFRKSGEEWEREASFVLLKEGAVFLDQPVGIRIQGHGSRKNALKRFSIYARKAYSGSRMFDVPLFEGHLSHALFTRSEELNAVSQSLAEGRDVLTMPLMKVVFFLNGEYWYSTYLMEKATEALVAGTYGVSEKNVAIVKNGSIPPEAKKGENPYSAIWDHLNTHDLSDSASYEEFKEIVDVQSFIDAVCFQTYLADMDYLERWNNYVWHTVYEEDDAFGDTRWRWGLYDMDLEWSTVDWNFEVRHYYEIDPFTMYGRWQKSDGFLPKWKTYSALRKNKDFCRQFVLTFMDLVNTSFRTDIVLEKLSETLIHRSLYAEYEDFFTHRAAYAVPFMAREFELSGTEETVTLSVNDPAYGTVTLNTVTPDLTSGTWSGTYFTDYPVTVTANAAPGFSFSYWEIGGERITEETAEVFFGEGGTEIHAVFTKQ